METTELIEMLARDKSARLGSQEGFNTCITVQLAVGQLLWRDNLQQHPLGFVLLPRQEMVTINFSAALLAAISELIQHALIGSCNYDFLSSADADEERELLEGKS